MLLFVGACASYYQRNLAFQKEYTTGQMEDALKELEGQKKGPTGPARVIWYLNKGMVERMLGNYVASIESFTQADHYMEDYRVDVGKAALAFLAHPHLQDYRPEDFENVLLHYFQAKNFIDQEDYEGAMVEVRRLNLSLDKISDNRKNITYKEDAFGHLVMGIMYETTKQYNDAFIAYRNAYEAYKGLYSSSYGVGVPHQLKEDMLRTAKLSGLTEELYQYEKEFGMSYRLPADSMGTLVFFWHNGLGPVKAEWAVTFTMIPGAGGAVTFKNEELGWVFPFSAADVRKQGDVDLKDTRVVRIALPKFVERVPMFNKATLNFNGKKYPLEIGEDINAIAFQDLRDRMLREVGIALLRVAMKQAAAEAARKKNEGLGVALDILGAATEHADTRNWQTLPHDIFYAKLSLPPGTHTLTLETAGPGGVKQDVEITVDIRPNRTTFATFNSLESVTAPLEGIYRQ